MAYDGADGVEPFTSLTYTETSRHGQFGAQPHAEFDRMHQAQSHAELVHIAALGELAPITCRRTDEQRQA